MEVFINKKQQNIVSIILPNNIESACNIEFHKIIVYPRINTLLNFLLLTSIDETDESGNKTGNKKLLKFSYEFDYKLTNILEDMVVFENDDGNTKFRITIDPDKNMLEISNFTSQIDVINLRIIQNNSEIYNEDVKNKKYYFRLNTSLTKGKIFKLYLNGDNTQMIEDNDTVFTKGETTRHTSMIGFKLSKDNPIQFEQDDIISDILIGYNTTIYVTDEYNNILNVDDFYISYKLMNY
jgi:hypothetical protein